MRAEPSRRGVGAECKDIVYDVGWSLLAVEVCICLAVSTSYFSSKIRQISLSGLPLLPSYKNLESTESFRIPVRNFLRPRNWRFYPPPLFGGTIGSRSCLWYFVVNYKLNTDLRQDWENWLYLVWQESKLQDLRDARPSFYEYWRYRHCVSSRPHRVH